MLDISNSNSFAFGVPDDPQVKTLPYLFRVQCPGYQPTMSW